MMSPPPRHLIDLAILGALGTSTLLLDAIVALIVGFASAPGGALSASNLAIAAIVTASLFVGQVALCTLVARAGRLARLRSN